MNFRTFALAGLLLALPLAACTPAPTTGAPVTNTDGSTPNTARQIAGDAYLAYIVADTAYLAYLRPPSKPDRAVVLAIEPRRIAARKAIDAVAEASKTGNAAAATAAAAAALKAFTDELAARGIRNSAS